MKPRLSATRLVGAGRSGAARGSPAALPRPGLIPSFIVRPGGKMRAASDRDTKIVHSSVGMRGRACRAAVGRLRLASCVAACPGLESAGISGGAGLSGRPAAVLPLSRRSTPCSNCLHSHSAGTAAP